MLMPRECVLIPAPRRRAQRAAIDAADRALALDDSSVKAWFRRAQACAPFFLFLFLFLFLFFFFFFVFFLSLSLSPPPS